MKIRKAVKMRILGLCQERNLTIHALSIKAGLTPSTLGNIISRENCSPGIVTLKIICDGLGISLTEFFDCDLFRTLEQEIE